MKKRKIILICFTAMVLVGCGTVSNSTNSKKEVAIEQHNSKEIQEVMPSIGNVTQSNLVTEEAATEELPEEYVSDGILREVRTAL